MIKKSLIGLILLAFIALPAVAGIEQETWDDGKKLSIKSYKWPIEFKWLDVDFVIPVKMDVGLFIEFKNKAKVIEEGILMKQTKVREYEGCSIAIEVQSNFDFQMKAKITRTALGDLLQSNGDKWSSEIRDEKCESKKDFVSKTLSDKTEKRTVWVRVKEAKVYELDFGKKIVIANVTIQVRPSFEAEWEDP